jgi:crotonobetainyl-CoA:carnitine CoA-transferase CaiB-like acyl-CoA transferase
MVTMMLADHGAEVIRIERPDGAPFPEPQGYRVWNRGKRSAVLDLRKKGDVDVFLALAATADIVLETFSPGVADKLGVGYETLADLNPRLIYCSITGYGRDTKDAHRPAFDQLVAARTGFQYSVRGWYGSPMDQIQGKDLSEPDWKVPDELILGSSRDGPIFTATPVPSIAAAYAASMGIHAALHVREVTGVGQRVETSMLQALIQWQACLWQRPEKLDFPGYQIGMMDRRQIWGTVKVKDGWINMWGATGAWAIMAAQGAKLELPDPKAVAERATTARIGGLPAGMMHDTFLEAVPYLTKFTRDEWAELAEKARFGLHPVRWPEEALTDELSLADGSVTEIDDPDLGPLRMAGVVYRLGNRPTVPKGPAPKRGQHTEEIRALAAQVGPPDPAGREHAPRMNGPLEGIRVLDFGRAVAGPWTSQLLGDLGADVLTIASPDYASWTLNHLGMGVNKSKRHVIIDIKRPEARPVLEDLLRSADIVTHNLRPGAAERMGIDYDQVRQINPRIIYLHTRAFEDGPRSELGGHDQAGNALGGSLFEDGGMWKGGRAYFSVGTGGDIGNGFLGAIACLQALYDRDRTGQGQMVDTSILNASLFSNSRIYTTPDGKLFERDKLDAEQTGFNALYRIYECADLWICLAVITDSHWHALASAIPEVSGLRDDDEKLASFLEGLFKQNAAETWFDLLDQAGVPCEVSSLTYPQRVFDDPELIERGWVTRTTHPNVGDTDMFGIGIDFSETPSRSGGPPPLPAEHTGEVLAELGYDDDRIEHLVATKVIDVA